MALELLSEYKQANRTANVYRSNNSGYTVSMFENDIAMKQEVVRREDDAEDIAEDWVTAVSEQHTHTTHAVMIDLQTQGDSDAKEGTTPPHLEV